MRIVKTIIGFLAGLATPSFASADPARDWISAAQARTGEWREMGRLDLPSSRIFIGDTSWGDDYHMRGAHAVPVPALDVWLFVAPGDTQINAVWLAAPETSEAPERIAHRLDFGMDSAYFAIGDAATGTAIADLRNREEFIPEAPDGFELFLPYVQAAGFLATWVPVPPDAGQALAVNTNTDGGRQAVWTTAASGQFTGILIDVVGTADNGHFIDTLLVSDG